jgi:hypothetical protein
MKLLQPLIDKVESIIRNRKYKEGEYFALENLPEDNSEGLGIRILKGKYRGTLLSVSHLSVIEDLGYKGSRAGFTTTIYESANHDVVNGLPLPEELGIIVSDILLVMLDYAVKNKKLNHAQGLTGRITNEQDREDYFEEPVLKRTVREEDSTIPEDGLSPRKKRKTSVRGNPKLPS